MRLVEPGFPSTGCPGRSRRSVSLAVSAGVRGGLFGLLLSGIRMYMCIYIYLDIDIHTQACASIYISISMSIYINLSTYMSL